MQYGNWRIGENRMKTIKTSRFCNICRDYIYSGQMAMFDDIYVCEKCCKDFAEKAEIVLIKTKEVKK